MKKIKFYFLLTFVFIGTNFKTFSLPYNPINKLNTTPNLNFIQADIESDNLISKNKIYNRFDALELRKNLEYQLQNSPNSIAISLALVKFHTAASAANGGFMGLALKYATNIFRQDEYIGCLAFEYIYYKNGDVKNAEIWYKNSLRSTLPTGMEWRLVKTKLNLPLGASVVGNFSNAKKLPMYQTIWSSFERRIMVTKCISDCNYNVIANFLNEEKLVPGKLVQQDW